MTTVFLFCAEEDEPGLAPLASALNAERIPIEVIAGIDTDVFLLGAAIDRNDGAGVYVLLESTALERVRVRQLEGVFSGRKGPGDALLILQLDGDLDAAITEIRRTGLEASEAFQDPTPDVSNTAMRDIVGVTDMTAVRTPTGIAPHHPLISDSDLDMGDAPRPKVAAPAPGLPKTPLVPRRPPPQVEKLTLASPSPRAVGRSRLPLIIGGIVLGLVAVAAAIGFLAMRSDAGAPPAQEDAPAGEAAPEGA